MKKLWGILIFFGVVCIHSRAQDPQMPEMVQIKGGTFNMGGTMANTMSATPVVGSTYTKEPDKTYNTVAGSPGSSSRVVSWYTNELPSHKVTVSDFRLSKTHITNAQYVAFLNAAGIGEDGRYNNNTLILIENKPDAQIEYVDSQWHAKAGFDNFPMVWVTWQGACEYCTWAGGRLPTEAEREHAAHKGAMANIGQAWKDAWADVSAKAQDKEPYEVGTKRLDRAGLYDMTTCAREWCSDWYGKYTKDKQNNPTGPESGTERVVRGGSWRGRYNEDSRAVRRYSLPPESASDDVGFRLAMPAQ